MSDKLKLKVLEVRKQTEDAVTLVFDKKPSELPYKAGQFLTLIFNINGKEVRRAYSMCSSPVLNENVAVTVKKVEKGLVSTYINDVVKAGDEIEILEPMGNFSVTPEKFNQRHIVLLGGGSGITPLYSILKTILTQEPQSFVSLIYANKDEENTIFKSKIDQYKAEFSERLKVYYHYDFDASEAVPEKKGGLLSIFKKKSTPRPTHISREKVNSVLAKWFIDPEDFVEFYICGPGPLMDVYEKALKEFKIPASKINKEVFSIQTNTNASTSESGVGAEVVVKLNGKEHTFTVDKDTILATALSKNIEIPFSCQSGLCTACMGKCIEGEVEMDNDLGLTESQKNEGFVLTCVGRPKTSRVVIDFN